FAFPSDSETLGFAALEAMAAGVPVVAARAGGIPHVVADGRTGLLVAPGSGAALADGLRRLLADPELRARMAAEGRREAERWSWRASSEALVAAYRKAIRLRGPEAARRAWAEPGPPRRGPPTPGASPSPYTSPPRSPRYATVSWRRRCRCSSPRSSRPWP